MANRDRFEDYERRGAYRDHGYDRDDFPGMRGGSRGPGGGRSYGGGGGYGRGNYDAGHGDEWAADWTEESGGSDANVRPGPGGFGAGYGPGGYHLDVGEGFPGYRPGSRGQMSDDAAGRDPHYSTWRRRRMDEFDRDYAEYRRERRGEFDRSFEEWRANRGRGRDTGQEPGKSGEADSSDFAGKSTETTE